MEKFEKLMDRNFTPVEWKLGSFEVRSNRTKERVQVCLLSCVLIGWKIVCVKLFFYWVVTASPVNFRSFLSVLFFLFFQCYSHIGHHQPCVILLCLKNPLSSPSKQDFFIDLIYWPRILYCWIFKDTADDMNLTPHNE